MKDALHLCMRFVLSDLPADARVLCVGVGTGPELLYLAESFAEWRFTAVEPSAQMLEVCRTRATELGVSSRCDFHEGSLDTLPDGQLYDAATAILVSHYLGDREARQDFFRSVSKRIRPGGLFVNADLAMDGASRGLSDVLAAWKAMLSFSGMSSDGVEECARRLSEGGTALSIPEIEAMITSSGFREPTLFCQTVLIHAWFSRRCG